MPSILEQPDVEVTATPHDGGWVVEIPDGRFRIRPWTWGERRHLIDASIRADGRFDAPAFVHGLVELVVRPAPADASRRVLAATALRLLGVAPGQRPMSLLDAEAAFAAAWGFGPLQLDPQPAPRLDQQIARFPPSPSVAQAPPAGWTSIVVDDGR